MIIQLLHILSFTSLLILYAYFIWLGLFYFKKKEIEDVAYFNIIKYLGVGLILLIVFLGFYHKSSNVENLVVLLISLSSFGLLYFATYQHRSTRMQFAFSKSEPQSITTTGPYKYLRHPIYAAYILGWIAGFIKTEAMLVLPPILVLVGVYIKAIYKEEAEFLNGKTALEYTKYMVATHRLIPFIY